MKITIYSDIPLSYDYEKKIRDIFLESDNPHESLSYSLNARYSPVYQEVVINNSFNFQTIIDLEVRE